MSATVLKVFLILGQSNAQGYGPRGQLYPIPAWANSPTSAIVSSDTGIRYDRPTLENFPMLYAVNGWAAAPPNAWGRFEGEEPDGYGGYVERDFFGPELSFLWRYKQDHPGERIAAIKCAVGGTSIEDWSAPFGGMWLACKDMIEQAKGRLAGEEYEWAGTVWMHGESGALDPYKFLNPTPGQEYSDKLRTFLSALRGITSPQMPVLVGRIGNHMLADNIILPAAAGDPRFTVEQYRGSAEYRRAQQEIVAGDPGNALVDTDNLPVLQEGNPGWWFHHTGPGYLAMGERFYAALGGVTPPPPPPPPLTVRVVVDGVEQEAKTAIVTLNGVPVGDPGDVLVVTIKDR